MREIIKQNIKVAIEALERNNFDLINIIGNRIATDAMIMDMNNLIIIGFFLKEVSVDLKRAEHSDKNLMRCKDAGRKFIGRLLSLIEDNKVKGREFWEAYFDYKKGVRRYMISDVEASIYEENQDFTRKAREVLLEHLSENVELLTQRNNKLTEGIISEMTRVINTYGFNPEDLIFYLLMRVFDSYYSYFIYDYLWRDARGKEEKRSELRSHIDNICRLFSAECIDIYEESVKIIGKLGEKWRKYFINFGEIKALMYEKGIELPPEAKRKIEEVIIEGLEREIKGRRRDKNE